MERNESPKGDEVLESPRRTPSEEARPGPVEPSGNGGGLPSTQARFSRICSEMMECLSDLARDFQDSLEELRKVESEIELRKAQLKKLHDIEVSANTLERLVEEQRLRMESFEALMRDQRRLWDEERARRELEDREYRENLRIQRQREEEEYRRQRALEERTERQRIDEELRAFQLENRLKLESLEKDLLQKELSLKEKEQEWVQLAQELERLMSRLVFRSRKYAPPLMPAPAPEDLRHGGSAEGGPS